MVNEEFKFSRGDDNSFVIQCLLTNIERRREAENELKKYTGTNRKARKPFRNG